MQFEDQSCLIEGVGIQEEVNPSNLWCGSSWLQLTENCSKACPEGSNDECGRDSAGSLMICYDMSASDQVCQRAGKGIKEKGDPNKRFCGSSYQNMMEGCPLRCMDGDCPNGMTCYEDTPCIWEGTAAPGAFVANQDSSLMYCGSNYGDAASSCGTKCPGGSSEECPRLQQCFSGVDCTSSGAAGTVTGTGSNLQGSAGVVNSAPAPAPTGNFVQGQGLGQLNPVPLPVPVPQGAAVQQPSTLVELKPAPVVAETTNAGSSAASTSTQTTNMVANDIRMTLSGLDEFGVSHLMKWEELTAGYFEAVFNSLTAANDLTSDAVNDVQATFDITEVNLSFSRRGRQLRRSNASRRDLGSSSYLITYTQTTKFSTEQDVAAGDVLQYPFGTQTKRDHYVSYLKAIEPALFDKLETATVFLPYPLESSLTVTTDKSLADAQDDGASPELSFNLLGSSPQSAPETGAPSNRPSTKPSKQPTKSPSSKPRTMAPTTPSPTQAPNEQPSTPLPTNHPTSKPTTANPTSYPTSKPVTTANPTTSANTVDTVITSGLELTLHGVLLNNAEAIFELQYVMAIYEQDFYNGSAPSRDYTRNKVKNLSTSIEITNVSFDEKTASGRPSTTVTFKQTIKYDTKVPNISTWAVMMQPFLTPEYRNTYVSYLKNFLPNTFGELVSISSIASTGGSDSLSNLLAESFLCSIEWPVDCSNTLRCESQDDCPIGMGCYTSLPSCTGGANDQEQQQQQQLGTTDSFNSIQTPQPTPPPSSRPTPPPSSRPTPQPSPRPTPLPSSRPTPAPTSRPSNKPLTRQPTPSPVGSTSKPSQPLPLNKDPGSAIVNSYVAPKPTNEPVSAPNSQQLGPASMEETDSSESADENDADAPCDLCLKGRVSRNAMVSVNGKTIDCLDAYYMLTNTFTEGSTNCISARSTMSQGCCLDMQFSEAASTSSNDATSGEMAESQDGNEPRTSPDSEGSQPTISLDSSNDEIKSIFKGHESKDTSFTSKGEEPSSSDGVDWYTNDDSSEEEDDWYNKPQVYAQWQVYNGNPSPSSMISASLATAIVTSFSLWVVLG